MEAIYAGSFDPFTRGHLEVVAQAANIFSHVVVLVAENPEKRHWFTAEQRREIVRESVGDLAEAHILPPGEIAVEYAYRRGACLVRGLGDFTDYPAEKTLYGVNNRLRPGVETAFLMTRGENNQMRSSSVREAVKYRFGWRSIRDAVPRPAFNAVVLKILKARDEKLEWLLNTADLSRYYHRPYHNLEHLMHMFDTAEEWNCGNCCDASSLWTAILYHDILVDSDMDVEAGDDVRRSVERLRNDFAEWGVPVPDAAESLILATDHKEHNLNPQALITPGQRLMCRLDFAVLGESRYEYTRYAKSIREEYAPKYGFLSDAFRIGRKSFLDALLARVAEGTIIDLEYDERLRDNAYWELSELERGR